VSKPFTNPFSLFSSLILRLVLCNIHFLYRLALLIKSVSNECIMINEKKKSIYLFSLQLLSFSLLTLYSAGTDHTMISVVILFAIEIALISRIKKGLGSFILLWQAQLFLVTFVGISFYPNIFLNLSSVTPSVQTALALAIMFVESIILILYHFKERSVVWILRGSTISLIAAVLFVLIIIMSEGLPGFLENDPVEMLTGTNFEPYSLPDSSVSRLNLTVHIDPYDFVFLSSSSSFHLAPNSNGSFDLTISNTGALNDSYRVTYQGDPSLDVNISYHEIQIVHGESASVVVFIKSTEKGQYSINFQVSDKADIKKECTIQVNVSTNGFNFLTESNEIHILNQGSSNTIVPLGIKNTGIEQESCILRISAPSALSPSLGLSEWSYSNNSATVSLQAGEIRNFTLAPRQLTMVDGAYLVTLTATTISGNQTVAVLNLTLIMTNDKIISPVRSGPIPVSLGNTTMWNISLQPGAQKRQIDIPVVPNGLLIQAYTNGTNEISIRNGSIFLDPNSSTTQVQLRLTMNNDSLVDNSSFEIVMMSPGTPLQFGFLGFIAGSAITTIIALVVAVPLALSCAIFLAEYCPKKIQRVINAIMETLAGIPSVVFGLWGALTFGPFLADTLFPIINATLGAVIPFFSGSAGSSGRSLLTASVVLGIMVFPIVMSLSYEAIIAVPSELKEGSISLGATRWQTVKKIILKKSKTGILGSIILGTGRALGETMAVLMILGFSSAVPSSAFDNAGTMTSAIATTLNGVFATDKARHGIFAIALLLFIFVLILNLILVLVTKEGFWSGTRIKEVAKSRGITNIKNWFMRIRSSITIRIIKHLDSSLEDHYLPSKVLERRDRIATIGMFAATTVMLIIVGYIIGDIIVRGGTAFKGIYLTETQLNGGFLNAITGSLMLVGVALAVAVPFTILAAVYIREYTQQDSLLSRATYVSVSTLSSTPSIIFGAFGFIVFILYLKFGFSLLSAGLTLAFMILPLLFISNMDALRNVPDSHREASYALGISKWKTIQGIVLPSAFPAISSGIFIGIGRAIGETAAVLLTAGFIIDVTTSLVQPVASMPVMIYNMFSASAGDSVKMQQVYAAAFLLIVVVIVLNLIGKMISHYYQKSHYGSK
jgi:phosphate transport system permease protein